MANTALKKITTRAKQLRKRHPGMQWKTAIKKAGADYRGGKLGSVKRSRSKYRQTGSSSKRRDKMRSARRPGKRIPAGGRKVTYTERRKNRSDKPGTLTGVSVTTLKSEIKNRLKDSLGRQLVRRELSTTKRDKRKITKLIRQTKSQITRLN